MAVRRPIVSTGVGQRFEHNNRGLCRPESRIRIEIPVDFGGLIETLGEDSFYVNPEEALPTID